ncbi:MAG: J domain-containing protein, partial [Clostridia bacterium]
MASLYEQKSFEVLGLTPSADAQAVRAAYRQKVKACHPDQFTEPEKQRLAQEQLIQLNLAYEEALKIASQ